MSFYSAYCLSETTFMVQMYIGNFPPCSDGNLVMRALMVCVQVCSGHMAPIRTGLYSGRLQSAGVACEE